MVRVRGKHLYVLCEFKALLIPPPLNPLPHWRGNKKNLSQNPPDFPHTEGILLFPMHALRYTLHALQQFHCNDIMDYSPETAEFFFVFVFRMNSVSKENNYNLIF